MKTPPPPPPAEFHFPEGAEKVHAFQSARKFTVWDVLPDKHDLLLRGPGADFNLDLIFYDVFWAEMPFAFQGLEIKAPRQAKVSRLQTRLRRPLKPNEQIFVLSSGTERFHIGARLLYIERSSLAPTDPDFYAGKYLHQSTDQDFYETHVSRRVQFEFPPRRGRRRPN